MAVPTEFVFWGGMLATGLAYEIRAVRRGNEEHTLSDVTRDLFHTKNRYGQAAFVICWGGFAIWFLLHITDVLP